MKLHTRQEFESRYDYLWIEIQAFNEMSSEDLIKLLTVLQKDHGKLSISVGYYSEVIISRLQTKQEYDEWIDFMYDGYVTQFKQEHQKELDAKKIEQLLEEKQKIDQQISSLLEENQKHVIVRDSGYGLDPNWKEEWGFVNGL